MRSVLEEYVMITRLWTCEPSDFQEGNDAYTSYFEQRFCGFYSGVYSTVFSEIRKHGLLMASLLEKHTGLTCQKSPPGS